MTVSEQIIQVINDLCTKFGIAINWTGENVIPYIENLCQKLIRYEIVTSIAFMMFWILLSLATIIPIKKFAPAFKEGLNEDWNEGWTIATVFSIIGLASIYIATIAISCCQINDIIKCVTFPEMYVFEYVSALMNQ